MSNLTLALGRPTLADRIVTRSIATDAVLVVAGAALTAALAQVAVPLWPVPITGQTLAVLLVGGSLGALRGTLSMVLYAVLGIVGLPVFSDASHGWGVVAGPTGGYIIGFIVAAGLTGWLAQRSWDRRFLAGMLSFLAGSAVVFAFGLPWLAVSLGLNLEQTLQAGLYPFIIGGIIKAVIAAAVMTSAWFLVDRSKKNAA
ncbi:MAG: biotin transport system substrate-specific component [Microbacteriaceae bacterium]|nr:biotin transport system substrate-specific component [Microbacteriaceae bacterium]